MSSLPRIVLPEMKFDSLESIQPPPRLKPLHVVASVSARDLPSEMQRKLNITSGAKRPEPDLSEFVPPKRVATRVIIELDDDSDSDDDEDENNENDVDDDDDDDDMSEVEYLPPPKKNNPRPVFDSLAADHPAKKPLPAPLRNAPLSHLQKADPKEDFGTNVWNKKFPQIMESRFYRRTVKPWALGVLKYDRCRDTFKNKFMSFAEAGASHKVFVQLTARGDTKDEQARLCQQAGECTACGKRIRPTGAASVLNMQRANFTTIVALCHTCDAKIMLVAQVYSALWAVSAQPHRWAKQGYALFPTPDFATDESGSNEAAQGIVDIMTWGVDAKHHSPPQINKEIL